ncbi:MAG: DUF4126 domain-containing protein [Myxococcales bacterium]|nr:DUF4126 domain-containing protein [Myxococcales bacterium]
MELGEVWGLVTAVALGIGLAATAGLRAWLPLLLAGGLARLGVLELGEAFGFVSSTPALVLFGVATVAEIVADKVPAVDHALDVISTVVRPAAGALLAASALYQVKDPLVALVIGLCVGAPVALGPHAAKSALRAASSATTAGIANPLVSFVEDALAIGLFIAVVILPVISVAVLATVIWLLVRRRRKAAPAAA